MLAVSCTECVVNVYVGVACEFLCELLLTALHLLLGFVISGIRLVDAYRLAFFLGIEAEVFKKQDFTGLEVGGGFRSVGAVGGELNVAAESLGYIVLNL